LAKITSLHARRRGLKSADEPKRRTFKLSKPSHARGGFFHFQESLIMILFFDASGPLLKFSDRTLYIEDLTWR